MAAARMGLSTCLVTIAKNKIGEMSCNPAIGGLAKGHLVREIDAMGGQMGKLIDATGIQFRMLNSSKGPATRGPRAQADRLLYQKTAEQLIDNQELISVYEGIVKKINTIDGRAVGVEMMNGEVLTAQAIVLCAGTFLNGLIHVGLDKTPAGRRGEPASIGFSDSLREIGFEVGRLKTGTCPRLDGRSIDYSKTEQQLGDITPCLFSFFGAGIQQRQISCHITYTTEETQKVIETNLDRSPLYTGVIEGVGPRYCPSIEDKVKRFPEKRRHQIFLEPEGLSVPDVYPNGLSTSLPVDVQLKFLRTIPGLEKVEILKPGYAIEYDFFPPTQLYPTLQTKKIDNLFFAGQINGTSGYEEAAAQGLVAGINAALSVKGEDSLVLTRQNSYIGVLIDDLVTKGTEEPYRMFTSRAEFRLLLRQDNADLRLCDIGKRVGLLEPADYEAFCCKREKIESEKAKLRSTRLKPNVHDTKSLGGKIPGDGILLSDLLKRPEVTLLDLPGYQPPPGLTQAEMEQIEIFFRYEGYIARQERLLEKATRSENKQFPQPFDFKAVPGISMEIREKLEKVRPLNLGQAARISGVTPAALIVLHIYLEKISALRKSEL